MKILITGGAGFIGSHIVESLLSLGHTVVVYDNFSSGSLFNLQSLIKNKNLKIIEGDILDFEMLNKSLKNIDLVSHHAAQLEIFLSIEDPVKDLEINTIGTLNVLKASSLNGVSKVINVSSACVYGQTSRPSSENSPTNPNWDYGVSKLSGEKYAQIYNDYKNLSVVNLRYSIVYGEREWYRRVMPIFSKRYIKNEDLIIFGKGEQKRDFIYIMDLVKAHNLCLFNSKANGNIYNIGSGESISIFELAKTFLTLRGMYSGKIVFEDVNQGEFSKLIEGKKRNSSELDLMHLDISKIKADLGWTPTTTLANGISNQLAWAKINLDRWNTIFTTRW